MAEYETDHRTARAAFRESLALYRQHGDERGQAWVLIHLGWLCTDSGHRMAARRFLERALEICERIDDRHGSARAKNLLGLLAWAAGRWSDSEQLHLDSLAISRKLGDRWATAWALHRLCVTRLVNVEAGRLEPAAVLDDIDEALAIWRELGDRRHFGYSTTDLGVATAFQGDHEHARAHLAEALTTFSELDETLGRLWTLGCYARVFGAQGKFESAVRLLAAVRRAAQTFGLDHGSVAVPFLVPLERYSAALDAADGPGAADAAFQAGLAMSLEHATAYVNS